MMHHLLVLCLILESYVAAYEVSPTSLACHTSLRALGVAVADDGVQIDASVFDSALPMDAVTSWALGKGGRSSILRAPLAHGSGFGAAAAVALEANAEILSLPTQLLLSTSHPRFESLLNTAGIQKKEHSDLVIALGVILLHEKHHKARSHFSAFINTLPTTRPVFLSVPDGALEQAAVELPLVFREAADHLRHLRKLEARLTKHCISAIAGTACSLDRVQLALGAVLSRAFALRDDRGETQLAMIPLADLMNHKTGGGHCSVVDQRVTCRTTFPVAKNEQVFLQYNALPSIMFLASYSFVPADNPFDRLALAVGLPQPRSQKALPAILSTISVLRELQLQHSLATQYLKSGSPGLEIIAPLFRSWLIRQSALASMTVSELKQRVAALLWPLRARPTPGCNWQAMCEAFNSSEEHLASLCPRLVSIALKSQSHELLACAFSACPPSLIRGGGQPIINECVKQRAPKLLKVVLSHPYHDINHEPAFGSSPLFEAMALLTHSEPSADAIAVVSMLIRHGASIISARGENALLRAAVLGRRQLLATMLKTLDAQHQEHIFKVDGEGRNILHYAAAEPGQVLIAAASLSEGTFQSLATAVDEQNKTALILAAIHGCGLACKRLVEVVEPVAVDHRDADGSTALHYAVAFANDFAARTLVDAGASCHLADADGFTVWDLLQEGDDVMKAVLRRCSPR